jgi:hypothetical protein
MAAKKAASKKAATKKGDEPVRVGRAKEQTMKGFIKDPYGYTDPKVFRPIETNLGVYGEKSRSYRGEHTADSKKAGKAASREAKELVAYAKKKYGKNFFVTINSDAGVDLTAGATKKGIKAQSARMTAQATAAKKAAAKRPSRAANTRRVAKGKK